MPYYLAPYIGAGTNLDPFRPRGSDQPGWSAIDLRPDGSVLTGRCLLHLPIHDPDIQLRRLADAPDETLTLLSRSAWGTALGIVINQSVFREIVAEILTLHARTDGTRWKPLRRMVDGRMRLYLGGLLHEWLPGSVGASIADTFDRDDGDLDGSTTSDGQGTWVEFTETTWAIVGNLARNTATGLAEAGARVNFNLASDDHKCEATLVAAISVSDHEGGVLFRKAADATETYYFWAAVGFNTRWTLFKIVANGRSTLGIYNVVNAAGDVMEGRADASTISGRVNGTVGVSVTDTEIVDNLQCGIYHKGSGGANTTDLNLWSAADLAAAVTPQRTLMGVGT